MDISYTTFYLITEILQNKHQIHTFIKTNNQGSVMEIKYTLHSEEQIKERKFEKVWIEETIKRPDHTNHFGNKYYVSKKLNGLTIEVVYVKEKYIKVITTYPL